MFSRFGNARGHVKYSVSALAASKRCGLAEIFSKNAAKPKEIEVLVGRTSYFTRLFARTVYVFFEGGAFWGPLGLPWVVSAASWDPPGALRGPSGRLLARGGPKKHKK